jgi:hypothetical protein
MQSTPNHPCVPKLTNSKLYTEQTEVFNEKQVGWECRTSLSTDTVFAARQIFAQAQLRFA